MYVKIAKLNEVKNRNIGTINAHLPVYENESNLKNQQQKTPGE